MMDKDKTATTPTVTEKEKKQNAAANPNGLSFDDVDDDFDLGLGPILSEAMKEEGPKVVSMLPMWLTSMLKRDAEKMTNAAAASVAVSTDTEAAGLVKKDKACKK